MRLTCKIVIKIHQELPCNGDVGVSVNDGVVTLTGRLDTFAEKCAVERAVQRVAGVIGVSNAITLKVTTMPANVAARISGALARHAQCEAEHIEVAVSGSTVTLRGHVDSWDECSAAYGAAWSAPGVLSVVNEIKVQR